MLEKEITMQFYKPVTMSVCQVDRWMFEPEGRFAFLQKWLWKALMKFDVLSQPFDDVVEYRKVSFKGSTVLKRILESRYFMMANNRKPTKILLGPDVMDEIFGDPAFQEMARYGNPMSFDVSAGYNREIYGLKVTIVPWMQGFLVLDESIKL